MTSSQWIRFLDHCLVVKSREECLVKQVSHCLLEQPDEAEE